MAKKRMHNVADSSKKKSGTHCGTITREQLLTMDRAARRDAEIASGLNPTSGCGAHGGDKSRQRRKARRQGKEETRKLSSTDW